MASNTPQFPTARHRGRFLLVAGLVLALLLWSVVTWELFVFVPRMHKTFTEFRMRIPWLAELTIRHSWWVVPTYTALTGIVCLGLTFFRKPLLWGWFFLLIILPIIISALLLVQLWFPYAQLVNGLTGRPPTIWEFLLDRS